MQAIKVLVVEDELTTATLITRALSSKGYLVKQVHTLVNFIDELDSFEPDVVLLDQELPDGSGLDVFENIPLDIRPIVIMVTAHATVELTLNFIKAGGGDLITKPVDTLVLDHRIQRVMKQRQLEQSLEDSIQENRKLLQMLQGFESTMSEEGVALDYFIEKLMQRDLSKLDSHEKQDLMRELKGWMKQLENLETELKSLV